MMVHNPNSSKLIIGLTGKMGSGKSYVAKKISENLHIPVYSFGTFIVNEASSRNLEITREVLQTLGEDLVTKLGAEQFLARFWKYNDVGNRQILDGIRHLDIWRHLDKNTDKAILIYLEVDERTRLQRVMDRDNITNNQAIKYLRHDMEKNIELLQPEADLIVSDDLSVGKLLESVISLLDE